MEEINQNSQTSLDFNSNILKPANENDLQEAIKHCYKKDLPIEIVGSGTKTEIGKKFQQIEDGSGNRYGPRLN